MAEKLKPCLHCNGKATEKQTNKSRFTDAKLYRIVCADCGIGTGWKNSLAEAIAAWNRRYVCPDKNGKPVYAGDEVKYTPRGQAKSHIQSYRCCVTEFRPPSYGYGIVGDNDFICDTFYPDEIELIQESDGGQ